MANEIVLTDVIAPNYYSVHNAIKKYKYTSYWLRGGRGSLKSSFAALQIIIGIIDDPLANALALRKIDNTIRRSIFETFLWAIDLLGLNDFFDYTRSPAEITYTPTGQKIMMLGLDDPRKIKSIRVKHGKIKYLWFEEAEEFKGEAEMRSVRQSAFRGVGDFVEFVTFNPPVDPEDWINKACLIERERRFIHDSNYLEVPRHWLGEQFFADAEELKRLSALSYEHEYMGQAIGLKGEVFKWSWFGTHKYTAPFNGFEKIVHSWDTAYKAEQHNDPSACTVWGVRDNKAYLLDCINERLEYPSLKAKVIEMTQRHKPTHILVEDKSSGQSLIQELRQTSLPVIAIKIQAGQDKIARASSATGAIEAGKIYVPENAEWLHEVKKQLVRFSFDKELQKKQHDDIVDSVSQFINWWQGALQIDYKGIYGY
ncbi:MAG: phage terminase large subunit [Flammeovirgaceae bacterium]